MAPIMSLSVPLQDPQARTTTRLPLAVFSLVLFTCLLALAARGATYYVDNSGPSCNDSPTHGSEAKPWCTISYALGRITRGDVLYVKSGVYREIGLYIASNRSGTLGQPTRIQAYPGAVVTIQGSGVNSGRVKITGCANLIFDGFIVTHFNQGIYLESSTNIVVQNCTVRDIGQEGIHVNGNSTHVTIQNCTVHDTGQWLYNGEGIYAGTGSAGPVDNTGHVTIRSNTVFRLGKTGGGGEAIELKPGTHNCVIEYNTVHGVRTGPHIGAIEVCEASLGVQSWASNPNHIVRNNRLYDVETAIRAGTGCLIYNNVIYNVAPGSYGIYVDNRARDNYARKIYHNTIDLPGPGAIRQGAGGVDIRNNLGPASTNNLLANPAFFVNGAGGDYHLVPGSAPIDAGVELSSVVPVDFNGVRRPVGPSPDLGAHEFAPSQPVPPQNLRVHE